MSRIRRLRQLNGFTKKTTENYQLDAGAIFINFDFVTDKYRSAKAAGKCLGVTVDGGEFNITNTYRNPEFDGNHSRVKGNLFIDETEVYLKVTLKEITADNLVKAIGAADCATSTDDSDYDEITGRPYILDSDFIKNVTWVGSRLDTDNDLIIQVFNAFSENGLGMSFKDKAEMGVEVQFYGYLDDDAYDDDDVTPPYRILFPKKPVEETQSATPAVNQGGN